MIRRTVPGTDVLIERKEAIHYRYAETPNGGRVDIVTSDPASLAAVHLFLKFQSRNIRPGDPTTIKYTMSEKSMSPATSRARPA